LYAPLDQLTQARLLCLTEYSWVMPGSLPVIQAERPENQACRLVNCVIGAMRIDKPRLVECMRRAPDEIFYRHVKCQSIA
jgi:hypothetical protein